MTPWIRRGAIAAGLLAAAASLAVGALLDHADAKRKRHVDVPARAVALRDDPAARTRGDYLYRTRGCVDCHGHDGAGREFLNDDGGLVVLGPQIAPGPTSVTGGYAAVDWERTIRHGVRPGGRPLMVMPSQDYAGMSDDDLASLVAHLRHLPPVREADPWRAAGRVQLPWFVRAAYGAGLIRDAAERIDHAVQPPSSVAIAATADYGRYVAQTCTGCHGDELRGGPIAGAPPDWPEAANLRGGVMRRYPTPEALTAMLREGRRPDGSAIRVMPFESLRHLDGVEVQALHAYLSELGAVAGTVRPLAGGG